MNTFSNTYNNKLDIEKSKITFDCLWKIKQVDVDIITLAKYAIHPEMSINNPTTHSIITLKELIGTETHKLNPNIQVEVAGKVGEILKSFEMKRTNSSVKISKITWL